MKRVYAAAMAAVVLAGCASTGNKHVDLSAVSSFKAGVTTIPQAEAALGPPFQESRQPDGTDQLQYVSTVKVPDNNMPTTGSRIPAKIEETVSMMLAFDQSGRFIHAWSASKTINENVPGNLGHMQAGDVSRGERTGGIP